MEESIGTNDLLGLKLLLCILDGPPKLRNKMQRNGSKELTSDTGLPYHPYHSFIAGFIGGYTIWGRYSSVNYQIVLYLISRVLAGLLTLGVESQLMKGKNSTSSTQSWLTFQKGYPYIAASVWGLVMVLFESYPQVLQSSLRRSMEEIYHNNQSWKHVLKLLGYYDNES